jgi:uncharacterized cupredoxin-like copper-binding protein
VRRSFVLSASLVLVAVLVGCGDDDGMSNAGSPTGDRSSSPADDDATSDHDGGAHGEASAVAEGARRVEVVADSLSFEPVEIHVTAGEDIAIVLSSEDMLHDFTIDDLGAHVSAEAGETAEGGFHAAEPGRYDFYCSVEGHREAGMEGTLVVD